MRLPCYFNGKSGDYSGITFRSIIGQDIKQHVLHQAEIHQTTLFVILFSAFLGASHLSRQVCENETMTLDCRDGVIDIISASYGRTQRGECGRNDGNTNCHAGTSMRVARFECQQQHRCVLHAKNSAFGDPCVGTEKYLQVRSELNC